MRLIDADDVLRSMKQFRAVREKDMEMTGSRETGCSWDDAVVIINSTPTVEPDMAQVLAYECGKAERKRGKWMRITDEVFADRFECSECGKPPPIENFEWWLSYYCPNCGADMRGEAE